MIPNMFRFRNARLLTMIILGICTTASVGAWSLRTHFAQGQGRTRTIDKAYTRNEVIEFEEIRVSRKSIEPGKAFDEDDDWLDKTVLKVKNISNKPIVYLSVNLDFPETKTTGSEMTYPVTFGKQPGSRFPQNNDSFFMLPGDSLEVPLTQHYAKVKAFIEHRLSMTEIKKVELRIHFVIFADKTGWAAGNFYKQDPNDPDHYINVGNNP